MAALLLNFLRSEAAGGALLILASAAALIWSNSVWAPAYIQALAWRPWGVGLSLHAAINDGLMAIFFLLASLEIRREMTHGRLASLRGIAAPGLSALGGMLVPAIIFLAITHGHHDAMRGWAIPVATDIAFSLAVLRMLGNRASLSLRVFLTALAIIDDLGAIIVIALFYNHGLSWTYVAAAAAICAAMAVMRRARIVSVWPYLLGGCTLWQLVLNSGVHATLSGVALAFLAPQAVAEKLEKILAGPVAFAILPIFGLANAGLDFTHVSASAILAPAPLGVLLGLFFGKQIGVFGAAMLGGRIGLIKLPTGMGAGQLYGAALLCGIGFTMSFFIGDLAFRASPIFDGAKLAIFCASLASALAGACVLIKVGAR